MQGTRLFYSVGHNNGNVITIDAGLVIKLNGSQGTDIFSLFDDNNSVWHSAANRTGYEQVEAKSYHICKANSSWHVIAVFDKLINKYLSTTSK